MCVSSTHERDPLTWSFYHRSEPNSDFPQATCCVSSLLTSSRTKRVLGSFSGAVIIVSSAAPSACFRLAGGTKMSYKMSLITIYIRSNNMRRAGNDHYRRLDFCLKYNVIIIPTVCCFMTSHHQCIRFNLTPIVNTVQRISTG